MAYDLIQNGDINYIHVYKTYILIWGMYVYQTISIHRIYCIFKKLVRSSKLSSGITKRYFCAVKH